MRFQAQIDVDGDVFMLARHDDPPEEGMAFRNDGERPMRVYVDGTDVGYLGSWPETAHELVYTNGQREPIAAEAVGTRLEVVFELGRDAAELCDDAPAASPQSPKPRPDPGQASH